MVTNRIQPPTYGSSRSTCSMKSPSANRPIAAPVPTLAPSSASPSQPDTKIVDVNTASPYNTSVTIPTASPTIVQQAMMAAIGVANKNRSPNPAAGTYFLQASVVSTNRPGISKSSTSP